MATEKQLAANRRNAQHSTGPKTPEGKAIVARNAIKHGLFTEKAVIDAEDPAEFQRHRRAMLAGLQPGTPMESFLAERIVALSWRLLRTGRLQSEAFHVLKPNRNFNWPEGVPLPDLSKIRLPRIVFGEDAINDFQRSRLLERLLTYECRMEKSLYHTCLQFERLQMRRLHAAASPPAQQATDEEPAVHEDPAPAEESVHDESVNQDTPAEQPANKGALDEAPDDEHPFRENKANLDNSLILEMLANSRVTKRY